MIIIWLYYTKDLHSSSRDDHNRSVKEMIVEGINLARENKFTKLEVKSKTDVHIYDNIIISS